MYEVNARRYFEELAWYIVNSEDENITADELIFLFNDLWRKENNGSNI